MQTTSDVPILSPTDQQKDFPQQATPTEVEQGTTETEPKKESEEEESDVSNGDEEDEQVQLWKQREREIFASLNEEDQERFGMYLFLIELPPYMVLYRILSPRRFG